MTAVAKHGVLVYANDIQAVANFYQTLFNMRVVRQTAELISLMQDGFNIIIHLPPIEMPQPAFNSVKVFMTVDSLSAARAKAVELGGQAFDGEWANPIFKVCNIADSDGNVIQLREFFAA